MASGAKSVRSRVVRSVLLVGVVACSIVWTYHSYRRFGEQLSVLSGIAISETRGNIRYKLGDPPVVYANEQPGESGGNIFYTDPQKDPALPPGADLNRYRTWLYNNGASLDPRLDVTFDANLGRVTKIDCIDRSEPPTVYCSRLVGAGIDDPESRIVALFGAPTRQSIDDESGVKTMDYSDIGAEFLLARQRVYAISIVGTGAARQAPISRFLIWISSNQRTDFKL